ncbi:MAG: hypothetical protein HZC49_08975 [Nitrospirae bacterium]|nr:hypothetical protein [Nitrospirota bacterium]
MKRTLLVFCFIMSMPVSSVFAQPVNNAALTLPDGHYWDGLDERAKEEMLFGLLMGYEWGYADGAVSGSEKAGPPPALPMFFMKPKYYVKQIDAFYESYPLCKNMGLLNVFGNLLTYWHKEKLKSAGHKNIRDISYSQIGEMCRKQPSRNKLTKTN